MPTSLLTEDFELNRIDDVNPHQKPFLTTKLGRAVDGASYSKILIISLLVIISSSVYFAFSPETNGIKLDPLDKTPNWVNSVYFSIVTFTSLGYGDILPQGYGKLTAAAVVLLGLILVALLIGKIASERQFAVSLLLYTSDSQRRLIGFCNDLKETTTEIKNNINIQNTAVESIVVQNVIVEKSKKINRGIADMQQLVEVISKYVTFHAHQARLAHFGNDSALKALYQEMLLAQAACSEAFKSSLTDTKGCERCVRVVVKITNITAFLTKSQGESEARRMKKLIRPSPELVAMTKAVSDLCEWAVRHPSPWLLSKIIPLTPLEPISLWKGVHENIAAQLGISKKLAACCIASLIEQKRLPRKATLSRDEKKEDQLKKDLGNMLDVLNSKTLVLEKKKISGAPILDQLCKLDIACVDIKKRMSSIHLSGQFLNHDQIDRKFKQIGRTQISINDIIESSKFNASEKEKANFLSYKLSRLADFIFEIYYKINPSSVKYHFIKIFNKDDFFFNSKHAAMLNTIRTAKPKMTLEELFAKSSKEPTSYKRNEFT